jgi:hypothetical protein
MNIYTEVQTKTCKKCNTNKQSSDFSKDKSKPDGLTSYCKVCAAHKAKAWKEANKEKASAREAAWRLTNKERNIETQKVWYRANKEKYDANRETRLAQGKVWQEANKEKRAAANKAWRMANKSKLTAKAAKRRAAKLQATPLWCEHEEIQSIYAEAAKLTNDTGTQHHVDHDVPLISDFVCGLHCLANLRIITAAENLSKGNRTWTDMS